MEGIQNYLETTYETIINYLIDKEIIIHDEDPFTIKAKKYLIKYKRLIGLISLIILILIPYYCFSNEDEDENVQRGGVITQEEAMQHLQNQKASREAMAAGKAAFAKEVKQKGYEEMGAKGETYKDRKAKEKEFLKSKKKEGEEAGRQAVKDKIFEKKAAKIQAKADEKAKFAEKIGKFKERGLKGNLKSGFKGAYNIGASGAEAFKDNAAWLYGILYSIAATVAIFMLVVPSIAFFVIGIMCFFLLKDKVKYFKGL